MTVSPPFPVPSTAVWHAFDALLLQYDRAIDVLTNYGVQLPPRSRFRSYRSALSFYSDQEDPVAPTRDLQRFVIALREIDELIQIVDGLSQPPTRLEIQRLRQITGGPWHPDEEDEKGNSPRDFQYELWLLSQFRAKGISAELAEPPDLWIWWGDRSYPVAAKRPRTRHSLDGRVRHALRQLDSYPEGGILAISLDLILRPRGMVLTVDSTVQAAQAMDLLFAHHVNWLISASSPIDKRGGGRNACAFLFTGVMPSFIQAEGALWQDERRELLLITDDPRSAPLNGFRDTFGSFFKSVKSAVMNREISSEPQGAIKVLPIDGSRSTMMKDIKKRRHAELTECFAIINTCLSCYYNGETHMYRPLAGQLRILLCDRQPLLSRVFPDVEINRLKPIEWLNPRDLEIFPGSSARLPVDPSPEKEFRLARMPFMITRYPTGLQVADLEFTSGQLVGLEEWTNQLITIWPSNISIRDVVRSVADKGGGAHVDDKLSKPLEDMMISGPRSLGVHVLFVIALGRLAQEIGLNYVQFRERFGETGSLKDVRPIFDPSHPSVLSRAKVPDEIAFGVRNRYAHTVLLRVK